MKKIQNSIFGFSHIYPENIEKKQNAVMREYNNETSLWNSIYKESHSADLRKQNLSVEWMFDAGLLFLAQNTKKVLDFGCGSGDILFQYHQYAPENYGVGIDLSKEGIDSANETLQKSDYHNLDFLQGGMEKLETFRQGEFDGIILSNVLDVMPENVAQNLLNQASRILREGGYWFIKLNPYYTDDELKSFGYRQIQPHLYDENGVLRLRQETTEYWKKILKEYGTIENYVEFCYWWQSGMNRLFLIKK